MPPIQELNLSENRIDDEGLDSLIEVMKTKPTLTRLLLGNNQISDRGVRQLAIYLSCREAQLVHLCLDKNEKITDHSVNYLTQMLRENTCLQELSLVDCSLTAQGKRSMQEAVQKKRNFSLIIQRETSNSFLH